ncbi:hypothetical protein JTE90_029717 [Oedothorax gibbosus]|uniref:Uncharacterized protein n=1 Tax=Oedothorax gibbosus TaxID=931172 RepID=A0AAV6TJH6_9ARAC|nr:hypothetical protein JTE90_029717 [Oedothorax gibbosus]
MANGPKGGKTQRGAPNLAKRGGSHDVIRYPVGPQKRTGECEWAIRKKPPTSPQTESEEDRRAPAYKNIGSGRQGQPGGGAAGTVLGERR